MHHWKRRFGERFFLFVGVIRYYKGLHILIEAARGAQFPVVIIGAGPIEADLKKQARELGVDNVFFLGRLPEEDKVALMCLSYAVVFPSHLRSEAFGVSLLEGAMYGKPLISSEIGTGTTYINIHGETGMVVPPGEVTSLRDAMEYLWKHPGEAREMGEKAEQRYEALFQSGAMTQSYVDLYHEIINDSQGAIENIVR